MDAGVVGDDANDLTASCLSASKPAAGALRKPPNGRSLKDVQH